MRASCSSQRFRARRAPVPPDRTGHSRHHPQRLRERLRREGRPVEDLAPADFAVKEGGKAREVVAFRPAKGLMQIALIVDDNGTGLFRAPLYRFVQRLQGKAEFAIVTVVGQPLKLTDYTMDGQVLSEALEACRPARRRPTAGSCSRGSTRRPAISRSAKRRGR